MIPLDGDVLHEVAPVFDGLEARRQRAIIAELSAPVSAVLDQYGINTVLRIAHFLGQVTHECAGFRTTEEFATGEAYEGRADLGNDQPGDGVRFKGRGLIQLTGRANYRQIGARLGLPLEDRPRLAADPVTSLRIACDYWDSRDINAAADRDDLIAVTRLVNGGTRGLEDRRDCLRRAKLALAKRAALRVGVQQGMIETAPILRRGSSGPEVARLQSLLVARGAFVTVDADFGAATEAALKAFQSAAGLCVDGLAGQRTWAALT